MEDYEPRASQVHQSLLETKSIMGAERGFALANGTIAAAMIINLHILAWIPIALALHVFLVWLHGKDPMMRHIYIRYNRQAHRYDPWPHAEALYNPRPQGFGRGMLC